MFSSNIFNIFEWSNRIQQEVISEASLPAPFVAGHPPCHNGKMSSFLFCFKKIFGECTVVIVS